MKFIIKTMETPEEIEGKSLVHWQTWREAYDDLLPEEFQETMTLDRCRFLSQKYPENTLIAMDGKKVVGFIFSFISLFHSISFIFFLIN